MGCLKEGVLLKLVEEMKRKGDPNPIESDSSKPVLLQIRSIIPVLDEGHLWPNRGFFLRVSDSSHALYVSLSKHQNDMVLSNKLQLGQFIHVNKLEAADPLPLLRGVAPLPGRRPCEGTPQDIVPPPPAVVGRTTAVRGGSSDSESSRRAAGRARSSSPSKAKNGRVDNEISDVDCVIPRRVPKRRSWSESEILGVKGIFDSSVVKHEIKLPSRSASANVSPVRSSRYDSSDDNSSSVSRIRVGGLGKRVMKSRSEVPATKANTSLHSLCNVVCDRKGAETRISWTSLPPNLVDHGKEVIRQRDVALQAAADALQEACVSERLLNTLSTMSQFPLAEGDADLQPFVDKFFNLEHDLAQTRMILQSLASTSPFTPRETESCTIKETMSIVLEREKNARAWIKSAIALDLSPCLSPLTTPPDPTKTTSSGRCTRPKGGCANNRNKRDDADIEIPLVLGLGKEDEAAWSRGSSVCAGAELATSLQDECKKVLLMCVDKYLEQVERKSSLAECDDQQMAGMMYKVKMVSDWLNSSVRKDGDGERDEAEAEAYARVRDKIYAILLKNVERTAVAFDRCNPSM